MTNSLSRVLRELHRLADVDSETDLSDAVLLERFCRHSEPTAFSILLHRHGPMVLGVCRRLLGHAHDAEDAFQATFLVLVRRAASIRKQESLGSWLYGVACHIARRAQAHRARRRTQLGGAAEMATDESVDEVSWQELRAVLDTETEQLPEKYRAALVLCYLEGKTHEQAAAELGVPKSSLSSRVARARELLRQRLVRRGITLSVAALASLLAEKAGPAAVPARLLLAAGEVARLGLAGAALVPGVIPKRVLALAEGAVHGLLAAKLRVILLGVVLGTMAGGATMLARPGENRQADEPPRRKTEQGKTAEQVRRDNLGDPLPPRALQRLGTTRLRPDRSPSYLAFSPDGTKVACWDGHLFMWHARTGRLLRREDLPDAKVLSLTWLPDGRGLALFDTAFSRDGVLVWDFTDPKTTPRARFVQQDRIGIGAGVAPPVADEADSCYAFSPDGKTLAVGRTGPRDESRPILLRPVMPGARVKETAARELARQPGNCGLLLFTPDGKRLVAFNAAKHLGGNRGWEDRQLVIVWDVATGKELRRFSAPRPPRLHYPPAAAVSDRLLAIGMDDGTISLWDLADGKERRVEGGHRSNNPPVASGTYAVTFTPDGKTFITGGRGGLVKLWDASSGRLLRTLEGHYSWVDALAVSRDGKTLVSCAGDGIRVWQMANGTEICPLPTRHPDMRSAALSLDGKTALTAGMDDVLRWWDTSTGRELRSVQAAILKLAISPDGRKVVALASGQGLRTWDLASGREMTPADLPASRMGGALSFTPDGRRLVVVSGAKGSVWEWPGLKRLHTFELPRPEKTGETVCQSLAISSDGRWLVTTAYRRWSNSASDGVADLWDLRTAKRVHRLAEGRGGFGPAAFTSDGRIVLAGAEGGFVSGQGGRPAEQIKGNLAVLDPLALRLLGSFAPPPIAPTPFPDMRATLLSPDRRTLYAGYTTGEVVAFEVASGQPRRVLTGHRGVLTSLSITSDGRRLLSGGHDGVGLVWDVSWDGVAPTHNGPPGAAGVDSLWVDLAGRDAGVAFASMAELARVPDRTIEFLRQHLRPAFPGLTDADLDRIVKSLDSEDFQVRDRASRELAALGASAVPAVRQRLVEETSPEVLRRLRAFLDRFDTKEMSPARLRQLRAIEVLEEIGTPSARELLAELAKGAAEAPLTRDAAAALGRLKERSR